MFSSPLTKQNCPALWTEQQAKDELREQYQIAIARFGSAPEPTLERPDIVHGQAHRLRQFAADMIAKKQAYEFRAAGDGDWRDQLNDTPRIRELYQQLASSLEPFIAQALAEAEAIEPQGDSHG